MTDKAEKPINTIRRTPNGVEFTTQFLKLIVVVSGLGVSIWGGVKLLVHRSDQIAGAVPRAEFQDTTNAIRGDIKSIAADVRSALATSNSIACYNAKYPAGLCDNVPRAMQAGSPVRRTP